MAVDLGKALDDLAERAPRAERIGSGGYATYRRAVRANVRIGLLALTIVALILIGSISTLLSVRTDPEPAAPPSRPGALAIPDQTWVPSPWTPGTVKAGPIGPLALVGSAPRHTSWFHTTDEAIYGVSAVTGTTRFLDLSRAAGGGDDDATLSPNGRYVAYFASGKPSGTYLPGVAVGVAVYDTVTGRVIEHHVASIHGLAVESLNWTGDSSTVVAIFSKWAHATDGGFARGGGAFAFHVGTDTFRSVQALNSRTAMQVVGPIRGGLLVATGNDSMLEILNPESGSTRRLPVGPPPQDRSLRQNASLSPNGTLLAADLGDMHLYVGDAAPGGRSGWRLVPTPKTDPVVFGGWLDDTHLLYQGWPRPFTALNQDPQANPGPGWYVVDVDTGLVMPAPFTSHATGDDWNTPQFAHDLLTDPFGPAHRPSSPLDPRIVPGIAFLLLGLLALYGFMRWLSLMNERRMLAKLEQSHGTRA